MQLKEGIEGHGQVGCRRCPAKKDSDYWWIEGIPGPEYGGSQSPKSPLGDRFRTSGAVRLEGIRGSKDTGQTYRFGFGQWNDTDFRVKWPNDNLGPRYNNFGKAKFKFRQLYLKLLVAGKLNIAWWDGVSGLEREARLRLLGDIVFYSAHSVASPVEIPASMLGRVSVSASMW